LFTKPLLRLDKAPLFEKTLASFVKG